MAIERKVSEEWFEPAISAVTAPEREEKDSKFGNDDYNPLSTGPLGVKHIEEEK